MSRKPTIKTIAELAGASHVAVYRAEVAAIVQRTAELLAK